MHDFAINLTPWLRLAAAAQLGIALLNLALPRIMRWRDELNRLPLLIREVFHVHAWFISLTLTIFAVMTWRFASEMTTHAVCRWLAAGIGLFWTLRTVVQVGYYSGSHWRGQPGRTAIHVLLLLIYGGFAFVYVAAFFLTR
jgi:hypothetical protein